VSLFVKTIFISFSENIEHTEIPDRKITIAIVKIDKRLELVLFFLNED